MGMHLVLSIEDIVVGCGMSSRQCINTLTQMTLTRSVVLTDAEVELLYGRRRTWF